MKAYVTLVNVRSKLTSSSSFCYYHRQQTKSTMSFFYMLHRSSFPLFLHRKKEIRITALLVQQQPIDMFNFWGNPIRKKQAFLPFHPYLSICLVFLTEQNTHVRGYLPTYQSTRSGSRANNTRADPQLFH